MADAANVPKHIYGLDETGNRPQASSEAGTLAYDYPATSHRLISVGVQPRKYDAAGNAAQMSALGYVYSSAGRLGKAERSTAVFLTY